MKRTRLPSVLVLSLALAGSLLAPAAGAQVLASGTFDLPASSGPGDPAFNSPLTAMHTMPLSLPPTAGRTLVVSLRDQSRPDQFCDPNDPFGNLIEGCATVDWPFPDRRGINLVEVDLVTGGVNTATTFHLRMDDTLRADPEPEGP